MHIAEDQQRRIRVTHVQKVFSEEEAVAVSGNEMGGVEGQGLAVYESGVVLKGCRVSK